MALICVVRTAVERRKARAPEALANGNIRRCGAPPHPLMRRQDSCALRRSASLFYWEAVRGNSLAKLGRKGAPRERITIFTSPQGERSSEARVRGFGCRSFSQTSEPPHPTLSPPGRGSANASRERIVLGAPTARVATRS